MSNNLDYGKARASIRHLEERMSGIENLTEALQYLNMEGTHISRLLGIDAFSDNETSSMIPAARLETIRDFSIAADNLAFCAYDALGDETRGGLPVGGQYGTMPKNMNAILLPVLSVARATIYHLMKEMGESQDLTCSYKDNGKKTRIRNILNELELVARLHTDGIHNKSHGYLYGAAGDWLILGEYLHDDIYKTSNEDEINFHYCPPFNRGCSAEDLIFGTGVCVLGMLILIELACRNVWGQDQDNPCYRFHAYLSNAYTADDEGALIENVLQVINAGLKRNVHRNISAAYPPVYDIREFPYISAGDVVDENGVVVAQILCKKLRESRIRVMLTQQQLAEIAGVQVQEISRIEADDKYVACSLQTLTDMFQGIKTFGREFSVTCLRDESPINL